MQVKTTVGYHLIAVKMVIIKNPQTINAREGGKRTEPSYIVNRNENWYSHCGEQYEGYLKN